MDESVETICAASYWDGELNFYFEEGTSTEEIKHHFSTNNNTRYAKRDIDFVERITVLWGRA